MNNMERPLITIGFDNNGEADFGVRGDIQDLTLEKMNQLRQIIPVAIKVAENMWYDELMKKPENQAHSSTPPEININKQ